MDAFISFLTSMPFWYWWVFAVVLLVIELSTGSTYFLWPAVAGLLVGLISVTPMGAFWQVQWLAFATLTIILFVWTPAPVRRWLYRTRSDRPLLNEGLAQKIGQRGVVDETFVNGAGKIRLGDTLWLAQSEWGENLEAGSPVEVTAASSVSLPANGLNEQKVGH